MTTAANQKYCLSREIGNVLVASCMEVTARWHSWRAIRHRELRDRHMYAALQLRNSAQGVIEKGTARSTT